MGKAFPPVLQSPLADLITQYVEERRALGYRCEEEARLLRRLDGYLAEQGLTAVELPRELVRPWLAKTPYEHPRTQAARAGVTRQLAHFLADRGLQAYVPPPGRREIARADFTPYIFTRVEIGALLAGVDRLPATPRSPRRHLVMPELFRMLYGCGLRISEAVNLTVTDVDLAHGVLRLREAKFRKDRLVPVAPRLSERLRGYAAAVDRAHDRGHAFFPNRDGGHYTKWGVYSIFRRLLREAGIAHGGRGRGPRLHDMRHSFAVHRLEDWYRQGANLAAKLPVLSAYMGHQSLAGTQRYLRLTPALFPDVVASVEAVVGHAMPGEGAVMKPTDLAVYLSRFFTEHLAGERNASPNTIKGYRDVFTLLLRHCRDQLGIPPERLTLRALTVEVVRNFLAALAQRPRHCARTRNHRLSAIHSFFRFVQSEDPELLLHCQQVLAIPMQKAPAPPVAYLNPDQLGAILAAPDLATAAGRRDAVLLCLLYDTGARVQEIIDLSVRDVRLDAPAQIRLTGKGRKTRVVPLMTSTVALLREYLREHDLQRPERVDAPLFWNRRHERLTRSGVRYILTQHAECARQEQPGLPSVHPHKLRHSKAMHLLQAGNPMVIIQAVLGHADIRTSSIYARADLEMTRAALEKTGAADPTRPRLPSWHANPGLMEWLRSL